MTMHSRTGAARMHQGVRRGNAPLVTVSGLRAPQGAAPPQAAHPCAREPRSSGPPAACTSRRVPATTVPVTSTAGVLGDRLGVHHLVLLRNITDYCMNGRVQIWVMGVWRWLGD